jgi:hypothetical protein
MSLSPGTKAGYIPAVLKVKEVSDKDCLAIEHVLTKYYPLADNNTFCGYLSDWDFTKTYVARFKIQVVEHENDCKQPICVVNTPQAAYLVVNWKQYAALKNDIERYGSGLFDIKKVDFVLTPKVEGKVFAYDVYVNGKPYITYEGEGNIPLRYDNFINVYLDYHRWAPLVWWPSKKK